MKLKVFFIPTVIACGWITLQGVSLISALVTPHNRTIPVITNSLAAFANEATLALLFLYYIFLAFAAHLLPLFAVSRGLVGLSSRVGKNGVKSGFSISLVLLIAIHSAMAWHLEIFPRSEALRYGGALLTNPLAGMVLRWLIWPSIALGLYGCWKCIQPFVPTAIGKRHAIALVAVALIGVIMATGYSTTKRGRKAIIIVGVDSLRPDYLDVPASRKALPHLLEALDSQVRFRDTSTPLARTFASWSAILSGNDPTQNGVRFNLFPRSAIDSNQWLPKRLQQAGYTTAFATDEVRFANIDRSFGFNVTATPPIGIGDFVFGTFTDFVPLNFLRQLPIAHILMPYVHGNRAAAYSYRIGEMDTSIKVMLDKLPDRGPVFLVVHFCQSHWPYAMPDANWHEPLPFSGDPEYPIQMQAEYLHGLRLVDKQFGYLWTQLSDRGLLDDATVVLLSDHGESLGLMRDRLPPIADFASEPTIGIGHGTVAMSDSQYRVLLAIQKYRDGNPVFIPHSVDSPVSLIDVAPTILTLNGQQPSGMNGSDLSRALLTNSAQEGGAGLARFRETDIRGGALNARELRPADVTAQFADTFTVTPNGRIELRSDRIEEFMTSKQRLIEVDGEMLMSDPIPNGHRWVRFSEKQNRRWLVDPNASDALTSDLYRQLCRHYEADRRFHQAHCTPENRHHDAMM